MKLPITRSGVEAAAALVAEGCRVTSTGDPVRGGNMSTSLLQLQTVHGIMQRCIGARSAAQIDTAKPTTSPCRPVLGTPGLHSCGDRRAVRWPLPRPHERCREAGLFNEYMLCNNGDEAPLLRAHIRA